MTKLQVILNLANFPTCFFLIILNQAGWFSGWCVFLFYGEERLALRMCAAALAFAGGFCSAFS